LSRGSELLIGTGADDGIWRSDEDVGQDLRRSPMEGGEQSQSNPGRARSGTGAGEQGDGQWFVGFHGFHDWDLGDTAEISGRKREKLVVFEYSLLSGKAACQMVGFGSFNGLLAHEMRILSIYSFSCRICARENSFVPE
jgi:hypothetical protein